MTGEGRAKSGWIQSESIRKDKEDVVTAVLLRKALKGKGNNISREEMEAIVAKLPYPDSYFVNEVMGRYEDEPLPEEEYVEAEPIDTNEAEEIIE